MRKLKNGFTLLEVAIFLAITGLLFLGVVGGVQTSLNQQRSNDTVQDFMEFLRGIYSQVTNVQNPNVGTGGQSEQAIYGKLITFGEKYDLTGAEIKTDDEGTKQVFAYTVVGNVAESGTKNTLEMLKDLGANVVTAEKGADGVPTGKVIYNGLVESYEPKWGAEIQKACNNLNTDTGCDDSLVPFTGSILIVRHPMSGNVTTYYTDKVIQVNEAVMENRTNVFGDGGIMGVGFNDKNADGYHDKSKGLVDFCVNVSNKVREDNVRYDVRIVSGARNASGVELIPDNDAAGVTEGSNRCKK